MLNKIVLDLETQKSFEEVGGLGEMLAEADQVIGFNIKNFDFQVLQQYLNYQLSDIPYLDILEEIEKLLGRRLKLDNLAQSTLGVGKSGDGLQALKFYKLGQIEELKKYCLDDVRITKDLYDYILRYEKCMYKDYFEMRELQMRFSEPMMRKPIARQAALF